MTVVAVKKPIVFPKSPYRDPFHPVLKTANPLAVNAEQELYLREILDICCSDSKFAEKAYVAILALLTASTPEVLPPVVTSVNPVTGVVGLTPVPIVVVGTDFDSASKVLWDGMVLNSTLFISNTELHAELFMEDKIAGEFEVSVSKDGVISNTVPFTVTDPVVRKVEQVVPSHPVSPVVHKK